MNPDPRDPDAVHPDVELASAYLDGHVTSVERDRVLTSPGLQIQVEAMAAVRAGLADVPAVPAAVREAALAAALAAFDEQSGSPALHPLASVPAPTRLVSRRRAPVRILTGAAAAAVVLVLGAVVLNSGGTDSSSSKSAREGDPTFQTPQDRSGGAEVAGSTVAPSTPQATIGSINGAGEVVPNLDHPEQLFTMLPSAPSTPRVDGPPPQGPAPASPGTTSATDADTAGVATSCIDPGQGFVAVVRYLGTPAVVVQDLASGARQARDLATCAVLVEIAS